MVLRLNSKDMFTSVGKLKSEWKQIDRFHDMEGNFLDKQIREFYSFFSDILYIVGFASLLVIVIASLGLLGMATYSTQTRIKEIAVRKAHGAQSSHIMILIASGYLLLLLIAGVIAAPLAYLGNNLWFTYMSHHVSFGIGNLLAGILAVIFIGLITIASQTLRAARTNASRILKYE
jgi:putative ABC transport system permease protein